ncbi:MAG: FHA domain-containing protein [Planctomycetota bacterium]
MARLVVVSGPHRGREFELQDDQSIGRLATNLITVEDKTMSREHTRIWRDDDRWWVEDLGSRNGTELNGEKVERERLTDDDHLLVGETEFSFVADDETDPAPSLGETARPNPAVPNRPSPRPVSVSSRDLDFGSGKKALAPVKEKNLSFSRYANKGAKKAGLFGQDLGQADGFGKFLLVGGVLLFVGLVFWFLQDYVAGR